MLIGLIPHFCYYVFLYIYIYIILQFMSHQLKPQMKTYAMM